MLVSTLFSPKINAQDTKDVAIAAGVGAITSLLVINSIEFAKERMENQMLNWILENKQFNNKTIFELKLIKWEANKKEELTSMSAVVFEFKEENKEPIIFIDACANGWINDYGINFSKVKVYEINKEYWGKLMEAYIENADFGNNDIGKVDLQNIITRDSKQNIISQNLNNLSRVDKKSIEFDIPKIPGQKSYLQLVTFEEPKTHIVKNFDENFIINIESGGLSLYSKETKNIIYFKNNFVVDITKILFNKN